MECWNTGALEYCVLILLDQFPAVCCLMAVDSLIRVRHSRVLLSLDFPRDGEVLEPSGIQAKLGPVRRGLRVVVSTVEPR
jgi:hypothetical protein